MSLPHFWSAFGLGRAEKQLHLPLPPRPICPPRTHSHPFPSRPEPLSAGGGTSQVLTRRDSSKKKKKQAPSPGRAEVDRAGFEFAQTPEPRPVPRPSPTWGINLAKTTIYQLIYRPTASNCWRSLKNVPGHPVCESCGATEKDYLDHLCQL